MSRPKPAVLRGMNLGGWLVLEKWMTPSLFSGFDADDEFELCRVLGDKKRQLFTDHRDTFITESDFKWLSDNGYNAVRLPVGFWIFEDQEPYVSAAKYLDFSFKMCEKYGLKLIVQLHAAPGSQNGEIHSGKRGQVLWHKSEVNIAQSIGVIVELAKRYGHHPNLAGIGLLNEPSQSIPNKVLKDYYRRTYNVVKLLIAPGVMLIISSQFRPFSSKLRFRPGRRFVLDNHFYLIQGDATHDRRLGGHYLRLYLMWVNTIVHRLNGNSIVGEYTFRLPEKVSNEAKLINRFQEKIYGQSLGYFYWTYKTETSDAWGIRNQKA